MADMRWDGVPGDEMEFGELLREIEREEMEFAETVRAVGRILGEEFGPGRNWPWAWARRGDLPECIIDAVFSIRARNCDVNRIIDRWRRWQVARGVAVHTTGALASLLAEHPELGPGGEIGDDPGQRNKRVFPRNRVAGRFKTTLVAEAARVFGEVSVETLGDLADVVGAGPTTLRDQWMGVHGLGETSLCHLRLLAGVDVLDPGVRVLRFLGAGRAVSAHWATEVIVAVADEMEVPPIAVEYALSLLAARSHGTQKRGGATPAPLVPDAAVAAGGEADAA